MRNKVWGKCEKPKSGKNVKNSREIFWKKMWKKLALKKRG
jgi:hypothetical protein